MSDDSDNSLRHSSTTTMDQLNSISRTPSPMADGTTTQRTNLFSIDYILSSSAAKQTSTTTSNKQINDSPIEQQAVNQHKIQIPSTAPAATNCANLPVAIQAAMSQFKPEQLRQQQQQQQAQMHPNFLYFMACMLLQRQQQQQQQQQATTHRQIQLNGANQQNRRQQQQPQQHRHPTHQHLSAARQPLDLATGPIDSLAILARLTGAHAPNLGASVVPSVEATSLGKQNRTHIQALNRHQPYTNAAPHQIDHRAPFLLNQVNSHSSIHSLGTGSGRTLQTNPSQTSAMPMIDFNSCSQQQLQQVAQLRNSNANLTRSSNDIGTCYKNAPEQQQSGPNRYLSSPRDTNGCNSSTMNFSTTNRTSGGNNGNSGASLEKIDNLKPAHSYIGLIGMCILSSPEKRMVLNDIYQFILDNYPYYRNRGSGWRNSVRHNLSLNECFQKAGRAANGKGHYWTIHPANMEDFMLGDFRRRRAQRKVRRWNNMDVPSDESDDESMDDANKPPLPEHFRRSIEMHKRLEASYRDSVAGGATTAAFMAAAAAAAAAAASVATPPAMINGNSTQSVVSNGGRQDSAASTNLNRSPQALARSPVFMKQPELP